MNLLSRSEDSICFDGFVKLFSPSWVGFWLFVPSGKPSEQRNIRLSKPERKGVEEFYHEEMRIYIALKSSKSQGS